VAVEGRQRFSSVSTCKLADGGLASDEGGMVRLLCP